jgi:DNA replication protein DnaC
MRDTWDGGCGDGLAMVEVCSVCEGSGLRVVQEDGRMVARSCECRINGRPARMLARARIPRLYEDSTLDNYEIFRGAHESLRAARLMAHRFVDGYPVETDGKGLLLTGSVGVGKTHLAIAVLRALVTSRGASGLFYGYLDLLKEVQNTYNRQVATTELDVLSPVFNAEILVLDEFGASKPSEWVSDIIAHILNTRYNERRTTIITTNFPNLEELPKGDWAKLNEAEKAVRSETLGDRIGERMRSRLLEMCVTVEMHGADFRKKVKPASFALDSKRAVAASELQIGSENDPNFNKVFQDGEWVEMITGGEQKDQHGSTRPDPIEERPVLGSDRMGKNKRVPRDVKVY